MQIYIHRDGQDYGPYTSEEVTGQIREGTMSLNDLAWHEGRADWVPLSDLGVIPPPVAVITPPPPPIPKTTESPEPRSSDVLGYVLLGIPTLAGLLIWRSAELRTPPAIVSLAMVVASGVLCWVETKRLGVGSPGDRNPRGQRRSGSGPWAAVVCLLWIFGFPAYLYWRSRYGLRNLLLPAIIVVVFVLAAPFLPAPRPVTGGGSFVAENDDETEGHTATVEGQQGVSGLDAEAVSAAKQDFDKLLVRRGSSFIKKYLTSYGYSQAYQLTQFTGVFPKVVKDSLTEIDRMNGVTWRGQVIFDSEYQRVFSSKDGGHKGLQPGDWEKGNILFTTDLEQRSGKWILQSDKDNETVRPTDADLEEFDRYMQQLPVGDKSRSSALSR